MSDLQKSIASTLVIFKKYACEDGDESSLSKSEAKKLLKNEMPELLQIPDGSDKLNDMVKDLDMDGDGKIDFMEFMILVMSLSIGLNSMSS